MASRNPAKWMAVALVALAVGVQAHAESSSEAVPARGVVKAVDVAKAEVTIDHGDIPGLMMAMTMTFSVADPAQLRGVSEGDSVDFKVKKKGSRYLVTEIRVAKDHSSEGMGHRHGGMMGMEDCRQMMTQMQAQDAELAQLVDAMKSAEGAAKVDAIAAVVETLVAQRQQMHELGCPMMQMHGMERHEKVEDTPRKGCARMW